MKDNVLQLCTAVCYPQVTGSIPNFGDQGGGGVGSYLIFLKMDQPRPLFRLFLSSPTQITIFATNKCEKCPSSIRCRDSNSRPLELESPPTTTRPGLPPYLAK